MIMVISKPKKNKTKKTGSIELQGKNTTKHVAEIAIRLKRQKKKSTCRLFNACDSMSVLYFSAAPKISPYNVKAHVGEKGTG